MDDGRGKKNKRKDKIGNGKKRQEMERVREERRVEEIRIGHWTDIPS